MQNFKKLITAFIICIFSINLVSCNDKSISLNSPITKKTDSYNFTISLNSLQIKEISYSSASPDSIQSENMYVIPIEVTNNLEDKKATYTDITTNDFLYPNAKLTNVEIYVRDKESQMIVGEPSSLFQYENINDGTALNHTKIDLKSKETKTFYLPLIIKNDQENLDNLEIVYKDLETDKYIPIS